MIIKKYLAKTEREAIELAKAELGKDAIVMNIKKVHPKGISKLFVRAKVEVTAALDENVNYKAKEEQASENKVEKSIPAYYPDIIAEKEESGEGKDVTAIEEKLNSLQKMLEKQMTVKEEAEVEKEKVEQEKINEVEEKLVSRSQACRELILKQLVQNEVDEKIATKLVEEISHSLPEDAALDHILAAIYQKIILMLGQPDSIRAAEEGTKFVFFLGPTGVGKTTTIAKIASQLKLNKKMNVALVTADTYRIAAVDQLKTYANILGVPLKVVYTPEELGNSLDDLRQYDICLVDTAGRSHRNVEQMSDIQSLLEQIPVNEREAYLVLNAGTKYKDLQEIVQVYSDLTDYRLIFTKLDETSCSGIMLNMRVLTDKPLSYVTWGQNVPDDIGEVDAQKVAKQLLGGRS